MRMLMFLTVIVSVEVNAIGKLEKGIAVSDSNLEYLATTSWEYAKSTTTHEKYGEGFAEAFILKNDVELYSLSDKLGLYLTHFKTREVMGNWSLSGFTQHLSLEGERPVGDKYDVTLAGKPSTITGNPLNVEMKTKKGYYLPNRLNEYFPAGCLQSSPLRYGDLEGDAQSELVLFLNHDMVVFSPDRQKTIFSAHYYKGDELSVEDAPAAFTNIKPSIDPQHLADSGSYASVREKLPARRSISKFYVKDFDANGKSDILIWRKLYESNLGDNPVKGFHLVGEGVFHYEKSATGEYVFKDDTKSNVAKDWLTSNNLTWQKGFPSKSECAGQEGQLIPEMHDPLLNDPDVTN